jgi:hypothetical protein
MFLPPLACYSPVPHVPRFNPERKENGSTPLSCSSFLLHWKGFSFSIPSGRYNHTVKSFHLFFWTNHLSLMTSGSQKKRGVGKQYTRNVTKNVLLRECHLEEATSPSIFYSIK